MSCRTAGGNNTPEKLWRFLMEQRHASGEVPEKRWKPWLHRDPRNAKIIANTTRKGYFIDDLENFDAAFFGISPKEAELMDPHQRLALELSWEALENAGIDPKQLSGSDTAVFMGVDSDDYSRLIMEDLPNIEAWSGIGTAYHVDAACASSLIAIHFGHQAILSGESSVALCGGVNVLCAPGLTHMLDKAGALASDGRCISFDDDAHGYARGEGGAIVVLKRLSNAIADNDNILAVLKGTATAQDGKTNGIMAPNAKAQEMVARQALARAGGLDPLTIGYVEAHATSTSLGDPTEVGAISEVYGVGRQGSTPCAIGSIKPNVGHLEAAAGAIGFVKAVMAVNKGELAPQTLLKKLNSRVDWGNSGLKVVQEASKWPESGGLRRAAVCSYGYGGSVAHAIIEQAPTSYTYTREIFRKRLRGHDERPVTLVLSSFQEKRLANQAIELADWLASEGEEANIRAIASTLAQRRAAQDYRAAFVVRNHVDAIAALREFAAGSVNPWSASGRILGNFVRKDVVWVFSGHGAQWPNMAKELLNEAVFYRTIESLDELIEREAGFSALSALEQGELGGASSIQILTYLVQVGLAALLQSKGVEPQAIIGHSVGEIAASVVARCLTIEEGALLVTRRARLYARVEGQGGMALVNMPFSQAKQELQHKKCIVAAIDSSPTSCVISGGVAELERYLDELKRRSIKMFPVKTDIAFHSPMLEALATPLRDALKDAISPQTATIPIYSTSSLDARTDALRDIDYWLQNMIEPVRLNDAVCAAAVDGYRIFLEVSAHPIVTHSISETLAAQGLDESATFGIMKRDSSSDKTLLHALAQLYTYGATVDFGPQLETTYWATNVPGTPWVQKPHWKEVETGLAGASQRHEVDKHTLLGQCTDVAGSGTRIFSTILDEKTKPYPLTHPLDNTEIIPAAVYCNTFHQATGATILRDLELRVPTPMTADQREVQVVTQGDSVHLYSRLKSSHDIHDDSKHPWVNHSSCKWGKEDVSAYRKTYKVESIQERIGTVLPNGFAWDLLQKIGVSGIAYPWTVVKHYGNDKEMIVKMDMDAEQDAITWDSSSWAPFLDAATSVGSSIFFNSPKMRIVSGIDQVLFFSQAPPKVGYLYIEEANDSKSLAADINVLNEEGELLAKLKSMRFSDVEGASDRTSGVDALVHQLAWVPPVFVENPLAVDHLLLVCDDEELSQSYTDDLQQTIAKILLHVPSVDNLSNTGVSNLLNQSGAIVVYVPGSTRSSDQIPDNAHRFTWEATRLLQHLSTLTSTPKLFIVTDSVHEASTPTALAQGPLYGFARIAAQEHPELWGGLLDNEGSFFPTLALKYVQEQDVVRIQDGLPRIARMRPFTKAQRHEHGSLRTLLPKPQGTYVVTGGFGDLGLEVLDFLVEKGARRIVVISRSSLPPRREWANVIGRTKIITDKIKQLESKSASIYGVPLDISMPDADSQLLASLDRLHLPPVLGVIHAAGVNEDGLIKDTTSESFSRVFAPKVAGALTLHKLFLPATLDFFILFSSIGQLVGTSGQAPYGAANAFLDVLAKNRRQQGDNAIAMQWTAWRGMGLAADSEFLTVELSSKGITDITRDEGFQAWEHLDKYNTDHAVVTRARILDADEPIPFPLVAEVAPRRPRPAISISADAASAPDSKTVRPTSGPEFKAWLSMKIRECVGAVLHMDVEDIDVRAAIADLGVDSVMTVSLRQKLFSVLGVKVPPTLLWKEPTVGHLVEWFKGKMEVSK
ncbi:Type I Iterative PKS [Paraconiothyrium brasiliense]|uniref:6-methylsalicylic acid synthase n=1 Tax=Paraconiothyrium brasiliense TaxID=300254 RepID=A0ABR3RW09_9PLEO